MARLRERVFAGFGALLFLGSACALTVYVIIQSNSSSSTTGSQTAQSSCADTSTEAALTAPTAYVPTAPVTSLQVADLSIGSGATAKDGDCLIVKYYGTLASNGKEFDQDYTDTTGFAFSLGKGQVISGWDEGLVGMKVGGVRRLVIPSSLAYGSQSPSTAIPANSNLVFVIKLLRIQNS
jgi:FKBP-type peptidyl-prolyl cis-trans isomerase